MLVSRSRNKLINAILYFAERTRCLGKIKLFKLLYLLDFKHFRQTGHPVTGMEYRAWKMGPVPARWCRYGTTLTPTSPKPSKSGRRRCTTTCARTLFPSDDSTKRTSPRANCAYSPTSPYATPTTYRKR
jgi:hypothetical protein